MIAIANKLEHEIGAKLVEIVERKSSADDLPAIVANALASHRQRCATIATGLLEGLEATHQGLSPDALDRFDDGWTPLQVRELVKHHRALVEGITAARVLLPKVLAGEP